MIQALSQPNKKKTQHINYRDSKLTRILQPHLSGNAEIAILCCASRSKDFIEETRATLKFALRAKHVQVKPKPNEVMDHSTIIRNLRSQLHQTRKELQLTEKRLQEELNRKSINIGESSTLDAKKARLWSSNHVNITITEKANESLPSKSEFQSDTVHPVVTGKHQRHHLDLVAVEKVLDSSQCSATDSSIEYDRSRKEKKTLASENYHTGGSQSEVDDYNFLPRTKIVSIGGRETNDSNLSLNVAHQRSDTETILGLHGADYSRKSNFRSPGAEDLSPNGRMENNVSWDAVAFSNESFVQNEQQLRTIETVNDKRRHPVPDEITIIDFSIIQGNKRCLTDRLEDAEARIQFLEEKLESSENIIEAGFRDLQRARYCIRDLVERNTEMKVKLKETDREDMKKNYEKGEIMVEQYWILKLSIYGSVFFFISGSQEYFLATAFFVWLALEINVTA